MNRYTFVDKPTRLRCHICKAVLSGFDRSYSGTRKERICVPCHDKIVKNSQKAMRKGSRYRGVSELWAKHSDAPAVFPSLIFLDGNRAMDMSNYEFIQMKMVDIFKYYSKVDA